MLKLRSCMQPPDIGPLLQGALYVESLLPQRYCFTVANCCYR